MCIRDSPMGSILEPHVEAGEARMVGIGSGGDSGGPVRRPTMQERFEHPFQFGLSNVREVDTGDGAILGGLEVPTSEDLIEQLEGDIARDERDLMAAHGGEEATVAAGLASGLALACRDEFDSAGQDLAESFRVGKSGEIAGSARNRVMDENESVTVIRLATGSWEIGLDHAEVRRVATERIPEAEEQSRLEGQHPFDGLELRDRKQNSDCLGNEFVSENEAVPLLLSLIHI